MLTVLVVWFAVSVPVALLVGAVIRFGSGE
jgi:hypothetical protein